ncbi:hypothetical protein PMIT1303_02352 [Prochlorococcus sp. MIT 1303]|nr:hypothetical protein PMIT1303_02352 [Prochlorococcus sp. MIT 1303]
MTKEASLREGTNNTQTVGSATNKIFRHQPITIQIKTIVVVLPSNHNHSHESRKLVIAAPRGAFWRY